MPPSDAIQQYFAGTWRMMTGHPDGIGRLDLSADGFWNSFFAIVVALPALFVGWVSVANRVGGEAFAGRLSAMLKMAAVDMLAWIVPLVVLAAFARPLGIAHRLVPYVVSSNWASALFVWMMVPAAALELFFPGAQDAAGLLSLVTFVVTMVLSWRLTNAAIGMGAATASWVFGGMFALSLVVLLAAQELFGLSGAP